MLLDAYPLILGDLAQQSRLNSEPKEERSRIDWSLPRLASEQPGKGYPYYIGDSPGITRILGWVDAWATKPSVMPSLREMRTISPPPSTVGAGTVWLQAYDAVTTKARAYVLGGGCTTVGVAGLIQSGGFGSFSKHYGTAAAGLLEAEVITADGQVQTANACTNPLLGS